MWWEWSLSLMQTLPQIHKLEFNESDKSLSKK